MCRLDYFAHYDDAFISLLKKSGLIGLLFGGESGSQRVLDDVMQKDIKVEDIIESVRKCKKHSITPVISFMIGNLGESKQEVKATLNLIDRLIKINPETEINGIFIYTPWPGGALFDKAVQAGLKVPKTLEEWGKFDMGSIDNNKYLSRRYKRYLKTIQSVSRFPFTKPINPIVKRHKRFHFFKELIYQFYCWSARIRWKYKFFYLGFEWRIMESYLKRFGTI